MLTNIYARYLLATNMPRLFELIQTQPWCDTMFTQWLTNLNIQKNNAVLDVGCGPGVLSQSIANNGFNTTGLDQSKDMIKLARKKHNESLIQLIFIVGDAQNLPFPNYQFTNVIAASLINIIPAPNKALTEMYRCTKKEGKVSFLVPSTNMNVSNAKKYCKENHIHGLASSLLTLWASKAICLSEDKVKELAKDAELNNIIVHHYLDGMVMSATGVKG